MDIQFRNAKDRELFNADRALVRRFGQKHAKALRKRLDQLRAASSLEVMRSFGRTHALKGDRSGQIATNVDANWRLVFEAADDPLPTLTDGGLDWSEVRTIRILEVVDYHD